MAMPQRDDTIEALKRRAAGTSTVEGTKKAEVCLRAAYRRKQRELEG
jgi:hypothetical protein